MPSQKSTAAAPAALAPKRLRGRLRVAAILDAASAVFAAKGYEAATMTEIAARADTAIGSLYRFFPTKEVLAEALLDRYADHLGAALNGVEARAAGLDAAGLAEALVAVMLDLRDERAAAVALIDARTDAAAKRERLRGWMRGRLAALLETAAGPLPPERAATMAAMLLQLLKTVPALAQEPADARAALLDEARTLIRLYLATAFAPR